MHIFRFTPVTSPTLLEQGASIPRPTSIRWSERFRDPGDFEIAAPMSSGLMSFLPEGSFISHTDTMEVMVVENHQITETGKEDPIVRVTGRSAEVILDNRIVGTDLARTETTITPYIIGSRETWLQARDMINSHIQTPAGANDKIEWFVASHNCTGSATQEEREIDRGGLYSKAIEILTVDDLGIRTIRRNPFGAEGSPTNTIIQIHKGVDRAAQVIFSWKGGDLESADYLFSGKAIKNSAMVVGKFFWVMVDLGPTKYDRRTMIVEAEDIDGYLDNIPSSTTITALKARMTTRGKQALKKQQRIQVTRADISNLSDYKYRRDYNVGDLVTVDGNFGRIQKMRVSEFVEIEDENGFSGHPTLTLPGE